MADKYGIHKYMGCPITGKRETRMSKSSFISMCLSFQRRAKLEIKSGNKSSINLQTFVRHDTSVCLQCTTGKKVKLGIDFQTPKFMEFIDFVQNKKPQKRKKLTRSQVMQIRELNGNGKSMTLLAAQFGVCRSTIHKIVHRITWKYI